MEQPQKDELRNLTFIKLLTKKNYFKVAFIHICYSDFSGKTICFIASFSMFIVWKLRLMYRGEVLCLFPVHTKD